MNLKLLKLLDKTPKPTFRIKSTTGDLVEIKDFTKVDLGVSATFYVHKSIKGDSYVVSEAHTGLKIENGANEGIAIGKARHKVSEYVKKNSEEAFLNIIRTEFKKIHPNIPFPEDKPVQPVKIAEPTKIEEPKQLDIEQTFTNALDYTNFVDVAYMANELGILEEEISAELLDRKLVFVNPGTNLLETNDEYLSGNVREKLRIAERAMETNSSYERNVEALKEVIPEPIPSALIQYSLGAAWIPKEIFEAFALSIFKQKVKVEYISATGKFSARSMNTAHKTPQVLNTYSGGGKNGIEIFNATLNNQQIIVSDKGVKKINETAEAQSMQEQMQEEFQQWIRVNKEIEQETEVIYNEQFNSYVKREIRIPNIEYYPNASKHKKLMRHQKLAVVRSLNEATGIAHFAGAGKTISASTTTMELRRLGYAKKPMIVVQKKTLGDFVQEFIDLYPTANVLIANDSELTAQGRPYFYQRIRDEDFDAVIMPHSQFELIPDNIERQRKNLGEQLAVAYDIMEKTNKQVSPLEYAQSKRVVKAIQKELDEIDVAEEVRIEVQNKAYEMYGTPPLLDFEQMGVDALLIDEFHHFKSLGFQTSLSNVKGINTNKSKRAQSCLLKMRWVQENNNGKNTIVYTGTPISNTMAEAWVMIKFLRPDILKEIGIEHFDQFAKTFGQIVPSLEQTGGGTFKIQNRFAKFQNLPEFIAAFLRSWDVVSPEDVPEFIENNTLPKLIGGKIEQVIVKRSDELVEQIAEFRKELEWYEGLEGIQKRQYNYIPLVIYNRAKQASIDLRLLNPTNNDNPMSKVNQMIRSAIDKYRTHGKPQMVFCDLYQSPEPKHEFMDDDCTIPNTAYGKPRFNLFNDIKAKLIKLGVKPNEIAILTEPKYDKMDKVKELFDLANKGIVKFLLGTTQKLGIGVNAQRKLYWLHHLDAPQRPMDFSQRNARIIRQGNLNPEVGITSYGTEKTLDSAAFQRLSIKQFFINQVLKGQTTERVTEDAADEAQMTFDEMMAHLSDSPYAMQKLLVDNKLKSERMKLDNFNAKQFQTQRQLNYLSDDLVKMRLDYEQQLKYSKVASEHFIDGAITELRIGDKVFTEHLGIEADGYVEMLINLYFGSPTKSAKGAFLLNGIKVMLEVNNTDEWSKKTKQMVDKPILSYTMPEIGLFPSFYGNGISVHSNSGTGLITSARYKVHDAIHAPVDTKRKIERYELNAEELTRTLDNVFDYTKMEALEAEIEVLKEKMLDEKNVGVEI